MLLGVGERAVGGEGGKERKLETQPDGGGS